MSDETPVLGTHKGHPILSTAIELPSLAGGLRDAVAVAGAEPLDVDEVRYLLVKTVGTGKTRYDPVKNTDGFQEVDIPRVEGVSIVEGASVEGMMAEHEAAVAARKAEEQRQKDEENGTPRIPGTEPYPTDADDDDTIDDADHVPGPTDEPEQA